MEVLSTSKEIPLGRIRISFAVRIPQKLCKRVLLELQNQAPEIILIIKMCAARGNGAVRLSANEFSAKFSTKREVFTFLTVDAGLYCPSYDTGKCGVRFCPSPQGAKPDAVLTLLK